jgi:hypothetical protein
MQCEVQVEKLAQMTLPSLGRFDAKSNECVARFRTKCIGPAADAQSQRLQHALEREKMRFQREYNDRLYSGLVIAALVLAVLSRFVLKQIVMEVMCWCSFLFLEVCSAAGLFSILWLQCSWPPGAIPITFCAVLPQRQNFARSG